MFAEAEQESWYAAFEKETSSPNSVNVNVADGQFNWSAALRSVKIWTRVNGGGNNWCGTSVECGWIGVGSECLWCVVKVGCAMKGRGRFVRDVCGN